VSSLFSDYQIWTALWATVKLMILSAIGSLILGTIIATLRLSPVGILRFVGTSYVNIFRNTPLTLIILSCSFVLYSTYALYASGKDAVMGGMLVTALAFIIWGFLAPRFTPEVSASDKRARA